MNTRKNLFLLMALVALFTVALTGTALASGSTQIPAGETVTVPAGSVVYGDVIINGQVKYDSDGSTGMLTFAYTDTVIATDPNWGASYEAIDYTRTITDYVEAMKANGCGGTCADVQVFEVGTRPAVLPPATDEAEATPEVGASTEVTGTAPMTYTVEIAGTELVFSDTDLEDNFDLMDLIVLKWAKARHPDLYTFLMGNAPTADADAEPADVAEAADESVEQPAEDVDAEEPTDEVTNDVEYLEGISFDREGQKIVIPAGYTCTGDFVALSGGVAGVFENKTNLFDRGAFSAFTGSLVIVTADTKLMAPWMGSCADSRQYTLEAAEAQLLAVGCGQADGCNTVLKYMCDANGCVDMGPDWDGTIEPRG